MKFIALSPSDKNDIAQLFTETFALSEGKEEGKLIGHLALELAQAIDNQNIFCFAAVEKEKTQGIIFFSELKYNARPKQVFMLAPVAVHPTFQKQGIGQSLITFGLKALRERNVDIIVTYGDPNFYSKVGFSSISEQVLPPPFALSMPEGWLAKRLNSESSFTPIHEKPQCVRPFQNPVYW